jgi:hypothetical protein
MDAETLATRCVTLARAILRGYRLDGVERGQETEGLAECLISAAKMYIEHLEHRRVGAGRE